MKFKFTFCFTLLIGYQLVMAQYPNPNGGTGQSPNPNEAYPNQLNPNQNNAPTYSIRYKGLRCNKPQEKGGDELTVYLLGMSADSKINDAMSLPIDSVLYENVKKGTVQMGPMATVFKGFMNQEATIFCAILERDAEESQKKGNALKRWAGVARNAVATGAQVHGLFQKPSTIVQEQLPNNNQGTVRNDPNNNGNNGNYPNNNGDNNNPNGNYPNNNGNNNPNGNDPNNNGDTNNPNGNYPNNNANPNGNYPNGNHNTQGLRGTLPPLGGNGNMTGVQKGIVATDKVAMLTEDFLFRKSEKRGDIINQVFFPLEKVDIQEYLKAERKVVDNIKHHFTIQIKDKEADYELFFEVIANQ
jgi:hypothetical protein